MKVMREFLGRRMQEICCWCKKELAYKRHLCKKCFNDTLNWARDVKVGKCQSVLGKDGAQAMENWLLEV